MTGMVCSSSFAGFISRSSLLVCFLLVSALGRACLSGRVGVGVPFVRSTRVLRLTQLVGFGFSVAVANNKYEYILVGFLYLE